MKNNKTKEKWREMKFDARNVLDQELDVLLAVVEGGEHEIGPESKISFALYFQYHRMHDALNNYYKVIDLQK